MNDNLTIIGVLGILFVFGIMLGSHAKATLSQIDLKTAQTICVNHGDIFSISGSAWSGRMVMVVCKDGTKVPIKSK